MPSGRWLVNGRVGPDPQHRRGPVEHQERRRRPGGSTSSAPAATMRNRSPGAGGGRPAAAARQGGGRSSIRSTGPAARWVEHLAQRVPARAAPHPRRQSRQEGGVFGVSRASLIRIYILFPLPPIYICNGEPQEPCIYWLSEINSPVPPALPIFYRREKNKKSAP